MPHSQYLERRPEGWYVSVRVPAPLVPQIGRTHFVRSLRTKDASVARERRWPAIAGIWQSWSAHLGRADAEPEPLAATTLAEVPRRARRPRVSMAGRASPRGLGNADRRNVEARARLPSARQNAPAQPIQAPSRKWQASGGCGQHARQEPEKADELMLSGATERWLIEVGDQFTKQTSCQHRAAIDLFARSSPEPIPVGEVTRKMVGTFVSEVLVASGRKQATVNRIISSLSALWRWLVKRGFVEANPWVGQGSFSKRPTAGSSRNDLTTSRSCCFCWGGSRAARGASLWNGSGGPDAPRAADRGSPERAVRAGNRGRARSRASDQDQGGQDRKCAARVPVHTLVWPLLLRRLRAAKDGLLFPELQPGGPDGKRSWYATKRYTEFRRSVLGSDDRVDFHSFRRTFATYLERASTLTAAVNASVTAELMGHTKTSLAFSLYSGGLTPENLRSAIDALGKVLEPEVLEAVENIRC